MQNPFKDRIDYLLQEWVNINSHASNLTGVGKILELVEEQSKELGFEVEWVAPEAGSDDKREMLKLSLPGGPDLPKVTLVSHADTAFTEDSGFQLITWTSGRQRAIGPGVLANKGGILVGLLALQKMSHMKSRRYQPQLLVMPNSEMGSVGFLPAMEEIGKASSLIIGLQPAFSDGSIVQSRASPTALKIAVKLIELHEKRKIAPRPGAGNSDSSLLARTGVPLFEGFGPIGSGARTAQETIEMASIFSRPEIIVDLIDNVLP